MKKAGSLYYLASSAFYIVAIIKTISGEDFPTMYYFLGSAFLCLGSALALKAKNDKSDKDKK